MQRSRVQIFSCDVEWFGYSGSSASGSGRDVLVVGLIATHRSRHTSGSLFNRLPIVFHDRRDLVSVL